MTDQYTPERIASLVAFVQRVAPEYGHSTTVAFEARRLGLIHDDGTLADWLRPEDWADRAARRVLPFAPPEALAQAAAIIRRHAEDRT